MVNKILFFLISVSTTSLFAQDEMYSLPIVKARMLVLDAFRAKHLDSLQYFDNIQIKALTADLMKCQADKAAIVQAGDVKNKAHDVMVMESGVRIQNLEGEVKKETKWKRFWKGAATVLAGVVLVETVILVAD